MFLWSTLCKQDKISKTGGERCIESTMKKEENYQGLKKVTLLTWKNYEIFMAKQF